MSEVTSIKASNHYSFMFFLLTFCFHFNSWVILANSQTTNEVFPETVARRYLYKIVHKNVSKFTKNTCMEQCFHKDVTLLKNTLSHVFFSEFSKNFYSSFFTERLHATGS